ncbi:helix-turn-helix domain-containing protein [Paenibacillus durus]|uniref:Transposase n=1 Tax=Paenibacillus durus ATCC 35681 TaxID=1333534 RepID=A0A0F7CG90_PAEDU|nr:transposase [Paenibacillus durus ATCC 35681]AKG35472.1 transposase [Paenibacillus durus ATCC 35681]AKG36160.1 transposase [Paenibacillus durus ATCC 35681]
MAKKGQKFQTYGEEFKTAAVQAYLEGTGSYTTVSARLGIRSKTQLQEWVKKYKTGEAYDTRKGLTNPLKGRQRTKFASVEEERDYLKAQVDYLKKRYPNLVREVAPVRRTTTKS